MVAPIPAQISKLPPRPPAAALPSTPLCDLCACLRGQAPHSVSSVLCFSPSSDAQASQPFCLHRTGASLSSLCALFRTRFLYSQQLAASFPKIPGVGYPGRLGTPGWGVPRTPFQLPTAHYPPLTTHSPLTTFRINTCKSVSKQSTLTTFRINTYAKQGEGGLVVSGTNRAHP